MDRPLGEAASGQGNPADHGRIAGLQQENEQPERAGQEDTDRSKAIVHFSDGTGNSSAKLFKTNVWRIYEAVDLGPSSRKNVSRRIRSSGS